MPVGKGKKPAQPGKKEEKPEAKKPTQEKKPEAKAAKKETAPKQVTTPAKKKDPATKPAAGGDAKAKDKGKKRKLNETSQGKGKPAPSSDSKKKKVEKKVQSKGGAAQVGKKPIKKKMVKPSQKSTIRRRRSAPKGKQEVVVYEGRRYFLLPNGKMKAMLDIKLSENDKVTKVEGYIIRKSDVKVYEEFKESVKNDPPLAMKRKLKHKLIVLRRIMMKDLIKEAKTTNKLSMATAKDAGREVTIMTMYRGTWVRKRIVPRLASFIHTKLMKIKSQRKEKGPKELTEAERKILKKYVTKILLDENQRLRHALLCKRPSVADKQKSVKKPASAKASGSKSGADKKQKRPAKKEKAAN